MLFPLTKVGQFLDSFGDIFRCAPDLFFVLLTQRWSKNVVELTQRGSNPVGVVQSLVRDLLEKDKARLPSNELLREKIHRHASPGSPAASCTWSRCMNTLSSVSKKSGANSLLKNSIF